MSADNPQADGGSAIRDLFRTVELGLDAKQFLESSLGQYVAQRAMDEMYAATQLLAEIDPFDHKAIVQAQMSHKVAAAALSWLAQAVEAGTQAEAALTAMDNTD